MSTEKIVLIDGHSILNRAFYGVPDLTNSEGLHTNAVYGFLNIMFKILDEEQADYLAVAFDLKAPTFRHQMYEAYKGTRKPMPEELQQQVPVMKEMLTAMGIPLMMLEGYEADDLLGTVSKQMEAQGLQVSIVSGDRDLLQLASETTCIRIPKTKRTGTEIEDYHTQDVIDKYQVTPLQIIDLKALMGDASDNIPGIPGVGEKTASKIISQYGSIENAYEHVEDIKPNKAKESLRDHYDLAQLSKKLATINRESPFELELESARIGNLFTSQALELYKKLEFRNLLSRFEVVTEDKTEEQKFFQITDLGDAEAFWGKVAELCKDAEPRNIDPKTANLKSTEPQNIDPKITELKNADPNNADQNNADSKNADPKKAASQPEANIGFSIIHEDGRFLGISVAIHSAQGKETAWMPVLGFLTEGYLLDKLSEVVMSGALMSTIHLKEQLTWLEHAGVPGQLDVSGRLGVPGQLSFSGRLDVSGQLGVPGQLDVSGQFFDAAIGAYLLNPLKNEYTYDDIAREQSGAMYPSREELLGKKKLAAAFEEDPDSLMKLACYQALTALDVRDTMLEKLAESGMDRLFWEIEMPLVFTLHDMEREGILVKAEELKEYGVALEGRIFELEKEIYSLAGEEFNINSPKQLGVILFEKLQMPYGKKTKTGYSTAADVLERLAEDYPLVSLILEYRQLTKLKSTYADGLAAFIGADGRIHSKFNQTITATGRISSTDPNLQNIPVRTELGRQLRKVFVPKDGYVFLDADYSQIELRVLAHVSGDEQLIQAYREAQDIHAITASQVFHVPLDQVSALERRNAKAVNFGIVYGISSFGLSQDLSITRKEAQAYIEQYFKTYPGIKGFLDGAVESAKEKGYAVTLFGRRRPVPELKSSNFMQRSFGERVAMNSPIQGTAADIIKIAMVRVNERLKKEGLASRLLLQVHDELLIETKLEEVEQVKEILSHEMMGAADLAVPLEIDMHTGNSWYEAK